MGKDHSLSRLTSDQFIRVAHATGLPVNQSVLDNLVRRNLLIISDREDAPYSRAHLYVLAVYYDAVRVYRHPWGADSSDRTLEDVRAIAAVVGDVAEASFNGKVNASLRNDASELVLEMERYLNTIDPYGPLANVVDFLKPEVVARLQGDGRLYAELRSVAAAVAALVDEYSRVEEHTPTGEVEAPRDKFERPKTVTTTLEADAVKRSEVTPSSGLAAAANPTRPSPLSVPEGDEQIESEDELTTSNAPASEEISDISEPNESSDARESEDDSEEIETDQPTGEIEVTEAPTVEDEEPIQLVEEVSASTLPEKSEAEEADAEEPEAEEPEAEEPEAEEPEAEEPEAEEPEAEEPEAEEAGPHESQDELDGDFEAEKTAEIQIPLPKEHHERQRPTSPQATSATTNNEFGRNEGQHTGRTRNLMDRLEELRNRDRQAAKSRKEAPSRDQADIESQIDELNKLRETHLAEQNWKALADLYVDRIDLFEEEPERQQIHLALATIYEAKLDNPPKALERFIMAFETAGPGRDKAIAGARRLARQDALANSYYGWVADYVEEAPAEEQARLQPDIAQAHHRGAENQRAFLTLASYLHAAPAKRITPETLEALETYSLGLEDAELDGFYEDILEEGPSDDIVELVGLRAAQNRASRGESHHALRYFRMVLDVAPTNQVAFNNVSRIYQSDENYGELAELIEARLAHAADDDEREKLLQDLERIREAAGRANATPESLAEQLEKNPDDRELLHRVVQTFAEAEQLADAYGVLNRVFDDVEDDDQKVDFLVNLASIAITALRAPEEAEVHLNLALDVGGPRPSVLGGLAQMHVANKDWMNAVSSVESILASAPEDTPAPRMIKWLEFGIEAAEKAHRGEEKATFINALKKLAPGHDLV